MKYLWNNLNEITALLKNNCPKVLFLDFDGTLTPIVKSPQLANISKETKKLLQSLCRKPNFYPAIVSSRSLEDIKEKVGIPNITYGGNHGLEGEIFGEKYSFPIPIKMLRTLKIIKGQLNQTAAGFKGLFIEDKNLTLSFHYRLADEQQIPAVKTLFKKVLKPYIKDGLVTVVLGKKTFDICPKVNWDKGNFAGLLIKNIRPQTNTPPVVIAVGDDMTDEDIFRKLKKGITIRVGAGDNSKAKYRLKDTKEVFMFLQLLDSMPLRFS